MISEPGRLRDRLPPFIIPGSSRMVVASVPCRGNDDAAAVICRRSGLIFFVRSMADAGRWLLVQSFGTGQRRRLTATLLVSARRGPTRMVCQGPPSRRCWLRRVLSLSPASGPAVLLRHSEFRGCHRPGDQEVMAADLADLIIRSASRAGLRGKSPSARWATLRSPVSRRQADGHADVPSTSAP
jgi:hypothetical protein